MGYLAKASWGVSYNLNPTSNWHLRSWGPNPNLKAQGGRISHTNARGWGLGFAWELRLKEGPGGVLYMFNNGNGRLKMTHKHGVCVMCHSPGARYSSMRHARVASSNIQHAGSLNVEDQDTLMLMGVCHAHVHVHAHRTCACGL